MTTIDAADKYLALATLCFSLAMRTTDKAKIERLKEKHRRYGHLMRQAVARRVIDATKDAK